MQLLSNDEAAKYLGVKPTYLTQARAKGAPNITFYKLGHFVKYDLDDLNAYLISHKFGGV
jgi:excisionase family DNA binding protein